MSAREGGEKEREGGRVMKGYVMNGGILKKNISSHLKFKELPAKPPRGLQAKRP